MLVPARPTTAESTGTPLICSARSTASATASAARSISMIDPLRTPLDAASPTPMTRSPVLSNSAMAQQTFVVPRSSAKTRRERVTGWPLSVGIGLPANKGWASKKPQDAGVAGSVCHKMWSLPDERVNRLKGWWPRVERDRRGHRSGGRQHQLAAPLTALQRGECAGRLPKRAHRVDEGMEPAAGAQLHDPGQFLARAHRAARDGQLAPEHAVELGWGVGPTGGSADHDGAARSRDPEREVPGGLTDGVEDRVDTALGGPDHGFDGVAVGGERRRGAELHGGGALGLIARGGVHGEPAGDAEQDRRAGHSTGGTVDEDALTGAHPTANEEHPVGGEVGGGQARGSDGVDRIQI